MSKERVLLVNPEPFSLRKPNSVEPLGLEYLAAQLEKEGIDVHILDGSVEPVTEEKIEGFSFVGLRATTDQYPRALEILKICQRVSDTTKGSIRTAIGGPHVTAVTQQLQGQGVEDPGSIFIEDGWSTACSFEADLVIDDIVSEDIAGFIQGSIVHDLDSLPFPARHLLNPLNYSKEGYPAAISVLFSRGCPYACTYCDKSVMGRTVRFRSPENVVEEIRQVINRWGIRRVLFYDDTLTINRKRAMELFEKLAPLKIEWECNSRVNTIDEEMLKVMRQAGCYKVKFGIESGNDRVLKSIDKEASVEESIEAIRLTKAAGITASAYFLYGLPEDDWYSMYDTLSFLYNVNPDSTQLAFAVPFPNTPLYQEVAQLGWSIPDSLEEYRYVGLEGPHTWLKRTKHLNEEEFEKAKNEIQKGFARWAIEKHGGTFGVTNVIIK